MRYGELSKERLKPWERYLLGLYGMRLYLYTYSEPDADGTITECYLDNFWQCLKANHGDLRLDRDFISKDFDGLISFDGCLIPCTVLPAKVYVRNNKIPYTKRLMRQVTRPYIRSVAVRDTYRDFSYRDNIIIPEILKVLSVFEGILENYVNTVTNLTETGILPQNVDMKNQLNSYLREEMESTSDNIKHIAEVYNDARCDKPMYLYSCNREWYENCTDPHHKFIDLYVNLRKFWELIMDFKPLFLEIIKSIDLFLSYYAPTVNLILKGAKCDFKFFTPNNQTPCDIENFCNSYFVRRNGSLHEESFWLVKRELQYSPRLSNLRERCPLC